MFYQGTMVNAEWMPQDTHPGWVFINWMYPGEKKISAVKDVRRIEKQIRLQGMKGWLASSEKEHTTMHKILKKMGAMLYGSNEQVLYFKREVA